LSKNIEARLNCGPAAGCLLLFAVHFIIVVVATVTDGSFSNLAQSPTQGTDAAATGQAVSTLCVM